MNNSTNGSGCVLSPEWNPVQLSYITNAIITLVLTPPAVVLNVVVMVKYSRLHVKERRRNSMFLILNQGENIIFVLDIIKDLP